MDFLLDRSWGLNKLASFSSHMKDGKCCFGDSGAGGRGQHHQLTSGDEADGSFGEDKNLQVASFHPCLIYVSSNGSRVSHVRQESYCYF